MPELDDAISIDVNGGVLPQVKIEAKNNFNLLLKKSQASGVTQKLNLPKNVSAPVKKDDVLGTVDFYSGDNQIGSVDVTAAETIDKMTLLTAFLWILDGLLE